MTRASPTSPADELALARRLARIAMPELPDDAHVEIGHDFHGNVYVLAQVVAPGCLHAIECDVTIGR